MKKSISYLYTSILICIYLFVNIMFIYKYGQRQTYISPLLVMTLYTILIGSILFLYKKKMHYNEIVYRYLYWGLIAISAIVFIGINFYIDGMILNVDRWSALELTTKCITEGNYPYTQIDHLGNMSSNFPSLGYIGLPFLLLGDVGYLQVFTFLVLFIFIGRKSSTYRIPLLILTLYLLSPALIWEIFVKSDLVSNIILAFIFIEFWLNKYKGDSYSKPILLGVIIAILILTRGIVIIPIAMFFLKDFWKTKLKTKLQLVLSVLISSFVICIPFITSAPDIETMLDYNPLVLQTNKTPILSYVLLLVPILIPYFRKEKIEYYFFSGIIIFMIPLISMISSLHHIGWEKTILDSVFDISYLSMSLPIILFWFLNIEEKGANFQ